MARRVRKLDNGDVIVKADVLKMYHGVSKRHPGRRTKLRDREEDVYDDLESEDPADWVL